MNDNNHQKFNSFLASLLAERIMPRSTQVVYLGTYPLLLINTISWGKALKHAATHQYRFVGIWANDLFPEKQIVLTVCVECAGEYLLFRTFTDADEPKVFSATPYFPAANRLERHIHDMFGVVFVDHPDKRRWTKHQAWAENQFPLRKDFSVSSQPPATTPPDADYPFITATGSGTYEIPVGPVHAGIIEPGHFRFQAAGEDIINLEERLGYVHKGIEKIAEGRTIPSLIKLAGRVSGDSTVAHAWAACCACENIYAITIPPRAAFIRAIMSERERIANHLGDFAAICNDVGFSFPYYQCMRLKELWLRLNQQVFKHRLMMDCIIAGGVACDINQINLATIQQQCVSLKKELAEIYPITEENSSLHDRLKTTGILSPQFAAQFSCLGYVGRASGFNFDLRHDAPYPPYDQLKITVPSYKNGDVLSRTRVRAREILFSLDLLQELCAKMPDGPIQTTWPTAESSNQLPPPAHEGIGLIEGWRGEVLAYVSLDHDGFVTRYFPRDPSWFSWPALEQLIHGNIVPDFPVCNKSINGSYAAVDL